MALSLANVPWVTLLVDPLDDELGGALVAARLVATGRLAPGRHGVTATGGLAFTTTMRVIHGVHDHAADGRADAQPDPAAGLAQGHVLVLQIAHLADGGGAVEVDLADFPGGHAELGVVAVLGHELGEGS